MTLALIISLAVYALIVSWICYIQLTKVTKLEGMLDILVKNMQEISKIINETSDKMNENSLKEAFSSDDEVGAFFRELSSIQEILSQFTITEDGKETEQQ